MNEFGDLVGLVGGGGTPGATRLFDIMRFRAQLKGVPVIPLTVARLRPNAQLRIHDAENRVMLESKPKKTDFRKGQLALSSWEVPMLSPPGVYRAEALIDDKPIWRGFVRLTP